MDGKFSENTKSHQFSDQGDPGNDEEESNINASSD